MSYLLEAYVKSGAHNKERLWNKEDWNVHTHKQTNMFLSTETLHLKFLNIKTHSIWLAA